MEVEYVVVIAVLVIGWFIAGIIVGKNIRKGQCDGTIVIEPTEEDDRERLIWKLDMDLDDIKKHSQVIFNVENNTSKKSQFV